MYTHLLRTTYPHPEVEAIEPEMPGAANDPNYASTHPAAVASSPAPARAEPKFASVDDEYYLGGYAGI